MSAEYPEYVRGIKDGTGATVTPLKHVQMYRAHFTERNIKRAVAYLKNRGRSDPPVFMEVDSRGTWSQKKQKLYWKADDGSTELLEVVSQEKAEDLIAKEWYRQDTPSGIPSLHKWLTRSYLGLSRPQVRRFVEKQKTWQLLKPLPTPDKRRQFNRRPKRPFQFVEIDTADMISFGQNSRDAANRYILVCVDIFSGFCLAEVQSKNDARSCSSSFKKMLTAIRTLGYSPPKLIKTDKGIEFTGSMWKAMDRKYGWRRIWNKNYPAVFAERKIRTLKTYISLNSKLKYGDGTMWWNVVSKSVVAVNRIFQKKGGSPEEIIRMDVNARKKIESNTKGLQSKEQDTLVRQPRGSAPLVGDSVRVRVASTKQLPRDYKGHLPIKEGVPTKWSLNIHKVEKKRVNAATGAVRVFADGRWRFWPSEILAVPATTEESRVFGKDGNEFTALRTGRRNPRRARKRPKRFQDFEMG